MKPEGNDMSAAIEAGRDACLTADRIVEVAGIPVAIHPDSMTLKVLTEALSVADARAEAPRRRKGTATHHELESFVGHVNRFKDVDSAIFADINRTTITAVLDYHRAGVAEKASPRWGEHRSIYTCPKSRQWQLWMSKNEQAFSQEAFGEFIDANMADLASPDGSGALDLEIAPPAAVLSMARTLVVRTKGEFSRAINPTTGESSLVNKLENESTSTKISRCFLLQLPVFESGTVYRVEARIRFAMSDGRPTFSYSLYQHLEILRDAFGEVRKLVADGTGLPVFAGSPE